MKRLTTAVTPVTSQVSSLAGTQSRYFGRGGWMTSHTAIGSCLLHYRVSPSHPPTYPRLAEQLLGDDPRAVEHVHAGTGSNAHLSLSGAGAAVRIARPSAELAPGPSDVRRHIAQIAGRESGDERTL